MKANLGRIVTGTAEMFEYVLDHEIDEDTVIDDDKVSDHHAILHFVRVKGQDARLFYEDSPDACRWFVESNYPV